MFTIDLVETAKGYRIAAELFKEYARQIDIDLSFQNFHSELDQLQTQYAAPSGALFLVNDPKGQPMGCFAIRKLESTIAELKRMYLRKEARGLGLGKKMLAYALEQAALMGYSKIRLDTLPHMHAAISLYENLGFYEIEPYIYNPIDGAKYYEADLSKRIPHTPNYN